MEQIWEMGDSFYPETDIKKEMDFEDSHSRYGSESGADSPPTLTNLTNVGYITGDANTLLTGEDSGFEDRYTGDGLHDIHPQRWNMWHVETWLRQVSGKFPLDRNNFVGLTGEELCQMNLEDFMHRDQGAGGMLYSEFQQLLYPQMHSYVPQPNFYPNFPTDFSGGENLDSFGRLIKAYDIDGSETLPSLPPLAPPEPVVKSEVKCEPSAGSTSGGDSSSSEESDDEESPASSRANGRRSSKGKGKLWEFIRDLLLNSETCPSIIKWENRNEGIFRIVKSDKVAKLWGKRKGNTTMTYEKMSRAMRYTRSMGYLAALPKGHGFPRKLVFKLGPQATGWKN